MNKPTFYLIDESVLPEVFIKVVKAKNILKKGIAKTVNDAVKTAGISRSAFYKYRDNVYPFYEYSIGRVVTLLYIVEDIPGILSNIIDIIALAGGNILTINQNIPVNNLANVTISIETGKMVKRFNEMTDEILELKGVNKQEIIASE